MKRIKELIESNNFHPNAYDIAEYDYKHSYDLQQEDKDTIIENYINIFRLVKDIKEIIDKETEQL